MVKLMRLFSKQSTIILHLYCFFITGFGIALIPFYLGLPIVMIIIGKVITKGVYCIDVCCYV